MLLVKSWPFKQNSGPFQQIYGPSISVLQQLENPPGYGPDYVFNKIHHTMQTEAWAFAIVVYNMYAVARSYA